MPLSSDRNTANENRKRLHSCIYYAYFYNLGDSTKYSFSTSHGTQTVQNNYRMQFSSNVLPQASTVDGIRIYQKNVNAGDFNDLTVSLYGIAES